MTMPRTDLERMAQARWARRRRRLAAYGKWQPYVDPERTRAHIRELRRFGLSNETIAVMAGEHESALSTLMQEGNSAYLKSIRPERERAYLAVRFDLDAIAPHRYVSTAGTRRRVEALIRVGWSQYLIAERLGVSVQAVAQWRGRDLITVANARKVRDLYDELAMRPGPSKKAAAWAAKAGWLPPLAWDDETIDDPAAQPDLGEGADDNVDEAAVERVLSGWDATLTRAERLEAGRRMVAAGWSDPKIAERLGTSTRTVERWRAAHGWVSRWSA